MEHANRSSGGAFGVIAGVSLLVAATSFLFIWLHDDSGDSAVRRAMELPAYVPQPVPTNRGTEVAAGFCGDVHPLLTGKTRLELTAHCTSLGRGRDELHKTVPESVYALFEQFSPAVPKRVYTETDFSPIFPERIEFAGQVWEIEPEKLARFLRQFHPHPSFYLTAGGRRAGPNGAFAILRALSPAHLDIMFRLHAEFDLAQNVWLTPACFLGRMIVSRETGQVIHFRMGVPTENLLNMHLTVAESMPHRGTEPEIFRKIEVGDLVNSKRDIVHVEQMELRSKSAELPDELCWSDSIALGQAEHDLAAAFYKFLEIDWVPWKEAVALASEQRKPILAIVLWGALDDQSC